MTEPGPGTAETFQKECNFGADAGLGGKQDIGIEVALQRAAMADTGPRSAQIDGPVQPDRIRPGGGNVLEP